MSFALGGALAVGARLKSLDHIDTLGSGGSLPASVDVAVIGAGIVGLSIAWRLASRGLTVAVFDRGPARAGASLAATGMLAAAAELEPTALPVRGFVHHTANSAPGSTNGK